MWTLPEAIKLCTLIQSVSPKHFAHPALTGGLLYKTGPRKDCDIVIYQRGDSKGERPALDWDGLWKSCEAFGLTMEVDYGYVKKCRWHGKTVDIFDPTAEGGEYVQAMAEVLPPPLGEGDDFSSLV
jgi:hypothetical protein